jgi:hypothetical protein
MAGIEEPLAMNTNDLKQVPACQHGADSLKDEHQKLLADPYSRWKSSKYFSQDMVEYRCLMNRLSKPSGCKKQVITSSALPNKSVS